ncbi:type IV toxin-antitoxin system AbiEi family antitoxin domain-containing protein [Candidatus Woesearchaeota archaeon]|nr:type IV toxin-antitoxin system AbiEi family antitoxin domain-containing protein [Candidatus Woesearchaeota archaeon]
MGKVKYKDRVIQLIRNSPVITIDSIRKIAGRKYTYLLLNILVKKGELHRLGRGCYSLIEDPAMAVFCFQPAYLGLQNALSIHNLWEQETNPLILTTKTVREGTREILGNNVFLRRIPVHLYFGVEYVQYGGAFVPVSSPEKTLLDMLYFRQPMEREVLAALRKKSDRTRLREYISRYGPEFSKLCRKLKIIGHYTERHK